MPVKINLKKQVLDLSGVPLQDEQKNAITLGALMSFVLNFPEKSGANKDGRWNLIKQISIAKEGEIELSDEQCDVVLDTAHAALLSPTIYGLLKDELK